MSYRGHLDALTVLVYSPLHKRAWRITPRQFRLICKLNGQRTTTQRALASETGYSLHGAHRTIESLVSGGIIAKAARRGRNGSTRLVLRAGARLLKASELNVPEQGNTPYIGRDTVTTFGNISESVLNLALGRIARPPLREQGQG